MPTTRRGRDRKMENAPNINEPQKKKHNEWSQNTVLLASTQAVYKAPHSTVRGVSVQSLSGSSSSSRKSQSVRLEHNRLEPVAASCT